MQRLISVKESSDNELVLIIDVATAQLLMEYVATDGQDINECVCGILLERGKKRLEEFCSYPLDGC